DSTSSSEYHRAIIPITAATTCYNRGLSVSAVKQASVVNLTISDPNREKARTVLATLIDIYNRQGLDDKNKVTANTIDFLNERLKAVALDLQGVEGQVQRFKTEHQITDVSSDAQRYMDMARGIDAQKAESETQLNIVTALERDLLLNQDNPSLVPSTLGIQEVSLTSLVEKHNSLILEKERIEKNKEIGPSNPLLIDLTQQVQETRRKLLANVRNLKEAYRITLNDISRKDVQLRGQIRNVPQMEQKLVEIQRNRNVQEQLYAFLLQKREEAAVTLASNIPDARTIVKARGLGQVSPKSKAIWSLAILMGILLPLITMLVGDFFNNKVGDAAEVEQKAKVPFLGIISHIRKIQSPIAISEKSRSVVAEQIRTLRTSIGFTGKGKDVRKLLITSSQPGDGKSFVSLNLAASHALLNKRTVIVELDLRKPHVGKYLGVQAKQGISSVLAGKSTLDEVIIEIPGYNENLYLLPAGYLPPNPAELISGKAMENLIAELSRRFEYVIIDTPPFGLVTDAVLLQQYVDITLVVLRQGHTHKNVYNDINQRIGQKPDFPMYTILNGVGWKQRYQGYGYGKYGGYGYTKGYYQEE
ncbi:MAG: polysaccharide biosynthesis tyrosine autokinase, partial [Chitinophagaceae bacterium]|nr:polysaccharide biosynthesis tyrosine autokinase [Chitinophagaceae bacterium]